jgi:hypothetical protein
VFVFLLAFGLFFTVEGAAILILRKTFERNLPPSFARNFGPRSSSTPRAIAIGLLIVASGLAGVLAALFARR